MAKPQVLLQEHLKALRLPTFLREYSKLARQCAPSLQLLWEWDCSARH